MRPEDWPQVEQIYREGIDAGNATFEADPPTWKYFDSGKVADARLVAVDGDAVIGWAAASPVSSRPAYRGVIEHSVYVAEAARGRGVGRPENTASITLHENHAFRVVGRREAIALMTYGPYKDQWRDTVLVEWRSAKQGR